MSDDLAHVLRVLAKHLAAAADELSTGEAGTEPEPEPVRDLDAIKRERAEAHKKLGGKLK